MRQPSDATVLVGMILFAIVLLGTVMCLGLGLTALATRGLDIGRSENLRLGWTCSGIGLGGVVAMIALGPWLWKCRRGLTCCKNCGYDLRGCRDRGRCPECGERKARISEVHEDG